jgi:ABC-2 type transport system ATP-binding protein
MVTDPFIIETADLRKGYSGVEAVRGLTLQVPRGSICGFLGRNGAGKTTTIKILLGMARPTSGEARVFGLPADAPQAGVTIRSRTGFVSEDKDLYDYMTVEEMIRFTAAFYPRWRPDLEQR